MLATYIKSKRQMETNLPYDIAFRSKWTNRIGNKLHTVHITISIPSKTWILLTVYSMVVQWTTVQETMAIYTTKQASLSLNDSTKWTRWITTENMSALCISVALDPVDDQLIVKEPPQTLRWQRWVGGVLDNSRGYEMSWKPTVVSFANYSCR